MLEHIYRTGEICHSGVYTCTNCGNKIYSIYPTPLSKCQICNNTEFTE
ncbi:MAG: hypothetical protein IJA61_04035 [Clostridia bacterium]|nr:hypothetical protein [Clostridia bacterium]